MVRQYETGRGNCFKPKFFFCMSGIFVSLCPTDLHLFLRFPICVISSHSSVNAIHDISHTMSHIPFIGSRYKWLHSFYLIYSYCHIEIVANPRSGGYTHLPVLQSVSMLSHHTKFQFDSYALSSAQHPYLHLHVVSGRVWSVAMCLCMCVKGLSACPCLASSYRYAVVCVSTSSLFAHSSSIMFKQLRFLSREWLLMFRSVNAAKNQRTNEWRKQQK